jgi:ribose transport system substrate-binding protein
MKLKTIRRHRRRISRRQLRRIPTVATAAVVGAALWVTASYGESAHGTGVRASTSAASIVNAAEAATLRNEKPSKTWRGPISGPAIAHNKTIAFVAADLTAANSDSWALDAKAAVQAAGWKFKLINGQGTAAGWVQAFNQALSLNVSGIITDTSANSLQPELIEAQQRGVPVVGFNFVPQPGPNAGMHVFYNLSSGPQNQGAAMADYVIATSNGQARAMILYDPAYSIAIAKADGMKAEFAKCSTCNLLAFQASPLANVTTDAGPLFTGWYQQYGSGWYVMAITDGYFDFAIPALSSAGVSPTAVNLVGSGGTPSAYQRIRDGQYETATATDAAPEWGFQAVDEMNRYFHKKAPVKFVEPTLLVVKSNVNKYGGTAKVPQYSPPDGFACRYEKIWKVKASAC